MYKYHTPSGDKSCDGLAMALRAGLTLRDMEMVQFHPTGLLAGSDTRMTGTVLEEGLRGAGGYLLNGARERFMQQHDARAERATRDIVSRAIFAEMRSGQHDAERRCLSGDESPGCRARACGVQGHGRALRRLRLRSGRRHGRSRADRALHDGRRAVQRRLQHVDCRDCSRPAKTLAAYMAPIASAVTALQTRPCLAASRAIRWRRGYAPKAPGARPMKRRCRERSPSPRSHSVRSPAMSKRFAKHCSNACGKTSASCATLTGLTRAARRLNELDDQLDKIGMASEERAFNLTWHDWLNLSNLILVSQSIQSAAAKREESRGAHFRQDFPQRGSLEESSYVTVRLRRTSFNSASNPCAFLASRPAKRC